MLLCLFFIFFGSYVLGQVFVVHPASLLFVLIHIGATLGFITPMAIYPFILIYVSISMFIQLCCDFAMITLIHINANA